MSASVMNIKSPFAQIAICSAFVFCMPSALKAEEVMLIILKRDPKAAIQPVTSLQCLKTNGLEHLHLMDISQHSRQSEYKSHRNEIIQMLRLPDVAWAICLEDKTCIANGNHHLSPEAILDILEKNHIQTPIQKLQAFLKRRPDHLEAREQLLKHLHRLACRKTRVALASKEKGKKDTSSNPSNEPLAELCPKIELSAEEDEAIWWNYHQELKRIYASDDWLYLDLRKDIDGFYYHRVELPLEAASPMIKGLLRKHRPSLLSELRNTPEDENLMNQWLWSSIVMGEPLIPFFITLAPPKDFQASGHRWPSPGVQKSLIHEAKEKNDWNLLHQFQFNLWSQSSYPEQWLNYDPKDNKSPFSAYRIWKDKGLPAMESAILTGQIQDAQSILNDVCQAPDPQPFIRDAVALARKYKKLDLVDQWSGLKPKVKMPSIGDCDWILIQTSDLDDNSIYALENSRFMSREIMGDVSGKPTIDAIHWMKYLGWSDLNKRWAVVDWKGEILAQGKTSIDWEAVKNAAKDRDFKAERPRTVEVISSSESQWCQTRSALRRFDQDYCLATGRVDESGKSTRVYEEITSGVLKGCQDALYSNIWKRPSYFPGFWYGMLLEAFGKHPEAESLSKAWLEALDEAILAAPNRYHLRQLWIYWNSITPTGKTQALFANCEHHPEQNIQEWPPSEIKSHLIKEAKLTKNWSPVLSELQTQWDNALRKRRGGSDSSLQDDFRMYGLPLAVAYSDLEQTDHARQVLLSACKARCTIDSYDLGQIPKSLAEYWNGLKNQNSSLQKP